MSDVELEQCQCEQKTIEEFISGIKSYRKQADDNGDGLAIAMCDFTIRMAEQYLRSTTNNTSISEEG